MLSPFTRFFHSLVGPSDWQRAHFSLSLTLSICFAGVSELAFITFDYLAAIDLSSERAADREDSASTRDSSSEAATADAAQLADPDSDSPSDSEDSVENDGSVLDVRVQNWVPVSANASANLSLGAPDFAHRGTGAKLR